MAEDNSSMPDPRFNFTTGQAVAVMIPMCTITVLVVLGNLLVIVAVLKDHSLRTPQNMYFLSLAAVDFLVGVFILPLNMNNQLNGWHWRYGKSLCKFYLFTDFTLCATSIYHLLAVAEDRFRIVSLGVHYIQERSMKDVMAKLMVVYILSLWIASAPLLGWGGGTWLENIDTTHACDMIEDRGFAFFSSFGCFWFPCGIMLYYYIKIYETITGKLRARAASFGEPSSDHRTTDSSQKTDTIKPESPVKEMSTKRMNINMKDFLAKKRKFSISREKKTAKTLGVVMGTFIMCWLPFTLYLGLCAICPSCVAGVHLCVREFVIWLGYLNSALNPIIYTVFNIEFRQAFKKVLHLN